MCAYIVPSCDGNDSGDDIRNKIVANMAWAQMSDPGDVSRERRSAWRRMFLIVPGSLAARSDAVSVKECYRNRRMRKCGAREAARAALQSSLVTECLFVCVADAWRLQEK